MSGAARKAAILALFWTGMCGCVTGKVLTLPGNPARPATEAAPKAEGVPAVAVLDFSWEGSPSNEVGRDYDHVRSIVWKGNAGKTMADLVAAVLEEKGVRAVRPAGEADVPAGIGAKVWGRIEEFRVNVKRVGSLKVEAESVVSLRVFGSGGTAAPGWSSTVGATYWFADPLFITPEGALQAINGAANSTAEETVRRLSEAGVVAIPKATDQGGAEQAR